MFFGALGGAFQPATGIAYFSGGMARKQHGIDIIFIIDKAILAYDSYPPGETHSGQTVILSNDNIAWDNHIDNAEISAVAALGDDNCLRTGNIKLMCAIAYDDGFNAML